VGCGGIKAGFLRREVTSLSQYGYRFKVSKMIFMLICVGSSIKKFNVYEFACFFLINYTSFIVIMSYYRIQTAVDWQSNFLGCEHPYEQDKIFKE
jgi:hypothetical protein